MNNKPQLEDLTKEELLMLIRRQFLPGIEEPELRRVRFDRLSREANEGMEKACQDQQAAIRDCALLRDPAAFQKASREFNRFYALSKRATDILEGKVWP